MFELAVGGLAISTGDYKVVRWCLNAITRLGQYDSSIRSIELTLAQYQDVPEIIAAAVSALARICRGQIPDLGDLRQVTPETRLLAALQTVPPSALNFSGLTIDIDHAEAEILKLALIVIGLNKDIKNFLHPKYENGEIVRALGQHDDYIVRQYSVWAVMENTQLTLEHLGVPLSDIDNQPSNVQAKLLQLGAAALEDANERQSLIIQGSNIRSVDAREGLSKGLVEVFYDGLPEVTLEWFDVEESRRVRLPLAEHFSRFSTQTPSYEEKALELMEEHPDYRERVLLGAEGTPLYGKIRQRQLDIPDLFTGLEGDERAQLMERIRMQAATNVLILNATPDDQDRIRVDREVALLEERMESMRDPARPLNVIAKFAVRPDQIQRELLNNRPKILHFSGHGARGELAFESHQGITIPLRGDVLASIVAAYGELDCVVLHACFTEEVARACAQHVDVVIGSTRNINDQTAPAFTYAFYQGLSHGRSYRNAFEMGKSEVAIIDSKEAEVYHIID